MTSSSIFRGFSRMFSTARVTVEQELKRKKSKVGKKDSDWGLLNFLACCFPSWSVLYMISVHQRCMRPLPFSLKDISEEEKLKFRNYLLRLGLTPRLIDRGFPWSRLACDSHKLDVVLSGEEEEQEDRVDYRNYLMGLGLNGAQISEHFPGAAF